MHYFIDLPFYHLLYEHLQNCNLNSMLTNKLKLNLSKKDMII